MIVAKIALFGIVAVLLAVQFRALKSDYAIYIGTACAGLICIYILEYLSQVLREFEGLKQYISSNREYFGVLLKMVGITYICEFSAGICKDAGFQAVAGQIEIFGKLCILLSGLPIVFSLLQLIGDFS